MNDVGVIEKCMKTKIYASISKDEKTRMMSSSGGIYSILAKDILSRNGVIFAACYDEFMHVVHKKIDNEELLGASRGAKYAFSDLGNSISEMRNILENSIETEVMFVGTPCQCMGVIKALESYRDRLLCVDFVCHGVPASKTWQLYLDSLEKRNQKLTSLNMRAKDTGWSHYSYCWKYVINGSESVVKKQNEVPYMNGFVNDLYLREACYNCKCKGIERSTDITLGDFWGIWDTHPEMDDNKGTSLVLIHSEKGEKVFNSLQKEMDSLIVTEDDAIGQNPSIVKCAVKTKKYDEFNTLVAEGMDFIDAIEKVMKRGFVERAYSLARRIKSKMKFIK